MQREQAARPGHAAGDPVAGRRTGRRIGFLAGLIGISCCVYPLVLFLLGLSTGAAAISLGNRLFDEWGWAFRGAAILFAAAAVVIHLRRRGECSLAGARRNTRTFAWIGGVGLATYAALYAFTAGLAALGS